MRRTGCRNPQRFTREAGVLADLCGKTGIGSRWEVQGLIPEPVRLHRTGGLSTLAVAGVIELAFDLLSHHRRRSSATPRMVVEPVARHVIYSSTAVLGGVIAAS